MSGAAVVAGRSLQVSNSAGKCLKMGQQQATLSNYDDTSGQRMGSAITTLPTCSPGRPRHYILDAGVLCALLIRATPLSSISAARYSSTRCKCKNQHQL